MDQNQYIWWIFLLPLISFLVISLLLRPFVKNKPSVAGFVTIAAILGSVILSVIALIRILGVPDHKLIVPDFNWILINGALNIRFGLLVDSLTCVMLVAVTVVSLMVQIYSQGYMKGDPGYHRYYAIMSLFTTSMLGLVLADNLLLMFMFWELVGLCSYLLIGFWFHRPSAANAAKKAFLVTRLGDLGFLAAILFLFANTGTFDTLALRQMAIAGTLGGALLTWTAIGVFAGAVGKSAQFPLHVWLPDAMEGPTPVSALIHSATMVSAGVFLVARTFPLFEHSPAALTTVAVIGGFTAIFAATMGLVMHDIKRVLAYSTISQLGFMMLGLGAGGVAIGIFHLFTHAFFKALLFLGAGSVSHAAGGTFDMRNMGGLRKYMPWTYATFLIGALSLSGIWPLAGFWSKDEILATALENQPVLFVLAMITVFMTAFYMFRAIFITFEGEFRGVETKAHGGSDHAVHLHESPAVMVGPMVLLAVLAAVAGFWNVSGQFNVFMGGGEPEGSFWGNILGVFTHSAIPLASLVIALAGIFTAFAIYKAKWLSAERIGHVFKPVYQLFYNKYYLDVLYEEIIVKKVLLGGVFAVARFFDSRIIDGGINTLLVQRYVVRDFFRYLLTFDTKAVDGMVNLTGKTTLVAGRVTRKMQTGQLQLYGLIIGLGMVILIITFFVFR